MRYTGPRCRRFAPAAIRDRCGSPVRQPTEDRRFGGRRCTSADSSHVHDSLQRFVRRCRAMTDRAGRMPAEWAPHERCLMAWPTRRELWGSTWDAARREYTAVAHAIAGFEPVTMVVAPGA